MVRGGPERRAVKRPESTATFATPDDPERGRCAARAKSSGERCTHRAAVGKRVCVMHGARGGGPPKNGRFSGFKGRIRESYDRWLEHVGKLELTNHLAALAALSERCIERSGELDTPAFRKRALALFEKAQAGGDAAETVLAMDALGELLERGASEDAALLATAEALSTFATHMEHAKALQLKEEHTVRIGDLQAMVANILDILMRHDEKGREIAEQIRREIVEPAGLLRVA